MLVQVAGVVDDQAMDPSCKLIGIAIVLHRGCCLVGLRGPGQVLAGYAEFPGGKCRAGESSADCAVRECREETGLPIIAEQLLDEVRHSYSHGDVKLDFWLCRPSNSASVLDSHQGYRWTPLAELPSLNFPAANQTIIQQLISMPGTH